MRFILIDQYEYINVALCRYFLLHHIFVCRHQVHTFSNALVAFDLLYRTKKSFKGCYSFAK